MVAKILIPEVKKATDVMLPNCGILVSLFGPGSATNRYERAALARMPHQNRNRKIIVDLIHHEGREEARRAVMT